jgi:hypothetical protein
MQTRVVQITATHQHRVGALTVQGVIQTAARHKAVRLRAHRDPGTRSRPVRVHEGL